MLNGKSSEWTLILSGVHEWSILGPCALFVVHEYDVQAVIISRIRFFVDDTSLYSVVRDPEKSVRELIRDLNVMNNWPKQWKISFNPDSTKPAETILSKNSRLGHTHHFSMELK